MARRSASEAEVHEPTPEELNQVLPNDEAAGSEDWNDAPSKMDIWDPTKTGAQPVVIGDVVYKTLNGKYGPQVQLELADGSVTTLPAHKYLQSRLLSIWGKIYPGRTVLRVAYEGQEPGEDGRNPMQKYSVKYRLLPQ